MKRSTQAQELLIRRSLANKVLISLCSLSVAKRNVTVLLLALVFILVVASSETGQAQTVTKDPKAIGILLSSLNAAGGLDAVGALKDMAASGNISYFWAGKEVKGSVSIKGLGVDRFRFDATLPDGTRSWVIRGATGFARDKDGRLNPFPLHKVLSADTLMFFLPRVVLWMTDQNTSILYMGTTSLQGVLVHHIRVQRQPPTQLEGSTPARLLQVMSKEFYIDSTTLLITRIDDQIYPVGTVTDPLPHSVLFSNYQTVNGVVLPFSVYEQIDGVTVSGLALDSVFLNTGVTDSAFN